MNEQEILEQILKETKLNKKAKEIKEGFIFEISEKEFEKSIKKTIKLSRNSKNS